MTDTAIECVGGKHTTYEVQVIVAGTWWVEGECDSKRKAVTLYKQTRAQHHHSLRDRSVRIVERTHSWRVIT